MKDIIIQHCYSQPSGDVAGIEMADMMRLVYQRHAAYAMSRNFDYWHLIGDFHPENGIYTGAWAKVWLIKLALDQGHPYVVWLDTDAAIVDFETDLRDALTYGQIGAVYHDAPWFKDPNVNIFPHYNVGALYVKAGAKGFIDDWLSRAPAPGRWQDQGEFNLMIQEQKYRELFEPLDAKWNSTIRVNEVEHPVVQGWHGVFPPTLRLGMMRSIFYEDHLIYKVV